MLTDTPSPSWPPLAWWTLAGQTSLWPTRTVMYKAVYIMLWFSHQSHTHSWHEQNWSACRLEDYTLVFDRNCLEAPKVLRWKWKCDAKSLEEKRDHRWQRKDLEMTDCRRTQRQMTHTLTNNLYTFTVDNAKYLVFLLHTLLSLLWNTAALFLQLMHISLLCRVFSVLMDCRVWAKDGL